MNKILGETKSVTLLLPVEDFDKIVAETKDLGFTSISSVIRLALKKYFKSNTESGS